ncbi:MAG: cytochrome c biogenesis protein CcsA, partial [Chloroflexi bacterium]|nr:cytochrome c biogenesis protein CcsA [Chloroflexota bacterium]
WAWDPVESASLLPWLVATAFLHSIMMQRRRGILKVWNMVLIILTFSLSIFGTFLTRSGVLSSVHTFGQSALGPFFMAFIGVILVGSLGLLFYRSEELRGEAEMESLVSRETTFLLNNLLLVGAAFATFLGTVFPLISEVVRGVKISVSAPFFNQVNSPIFLAVILLAGICALIGWRRASAKNLVRHFLWPLVTSIILGIVLFIFGVREVYAIIAFPVCAFVLFTILYEWWRGTRARHRVRAENYLKAFWGLIGSNRPRNGGYIVHIGIIILAIGVTASSVYSVEKEFSIKPGEVMTINNYNLTYLSKDSYTTQGKNFDTTTLSVYKQGELLDQLTPLKYLQLSDQQTVSQVAIHPTLLEDLYVILVGWDADGTTAFKVLVNPLVMWIWIGGIVVVLGGLVAFWPERQKLSALQQAEGRGSRSYQFFSHPGEGKSRS